MANPAAPAAGAKPEEKKRITAAGTCALDAEREEQERTAAAAAGGDQSFPSLYSAISAKIKRKKPVTISLAQFLAPKPQGLATADILRLPTASREYSADELHGFSHFAYFGGCPRPPPDLNLPSKADESGSWAAGIRLSAPPEWHGR